MTAQLMTVTDICVCDCLTSAACCYTSNHRLSVIKKQQRQENTRWNAGFILLSVTAGDEKTINSSITTTRMASTTSVRLSWTSRVCFQFH